MTQSEPIKRRCLFQSKLSQSEQTGVRATQSHQHRDVKGVLDSIVTKCEHDQADKAQYARLEALNQLNL